MGTIRKNALWQNTLLKNTIWKNTHWKNKSGSEGVIIIRERCLKETDLRDADREDSVAQLFPHKQPKNLGRGRTGVMLAR